MFFINKTNNLVSYFTDLMNNECVPCYLTCLSCVDNTKSSLKCLTC